jgi:hypothetical protein
VAAAEDIRAERAQALRQELRRDFVVPMR